MKRIILASVLLATPAYAITGKSVICDHIDYMSVGPGMCQDAEVLPFELKDKGIAKIKAENPQPITETRISVHVKNEIPKDDTNPIKVTGTYEQGE